MEHGSLYYVRQGSDPPVKNLRQSEESAEEMFWRQPGLRAAAVLPTCARGLVHSFGPMQLRFEERGLNYFHSGNGFWRSGRFNLL